MKFLLCLALCFAAAQAGLVGVPSALTYSAPYTTYTAGVAPVASVYNAPLAYSAYPGYPATYTSRLAAPTVYTSAGLVSSPYAAPTVYSAPTVLNTLLKK